MGVPGIRGLEGDGARGHAEPVDRQLVDARVGLNTPTSSTDHT